MRDRSPSPGTDTEPWSERLSVPWWWWPLGLACAALLSAELHLGYPGLRAWLPYALILPLTALLLVWLGRVRVGVETSGSGEHADRGSGEHADRGARIVAGARGLAVRHAGRVDVVRGPAKQDATGPGLDPAAYFLHRPWIGAAVRIEVLDPADPTPYWVISARHPERLVAALRHEAQRGDAPEAGY